MSGDDLRSDYPGLMNGLGQGYALYKPTEAKELKPGTCGYFDGHGDWVQILDIFDLPKDGGKYKEMDDPPKLKKRVPEEWGPQYSEGIQCLAVPIEISASAPEVPANIRVELQFTSSKAENAALVVGPVTKEFYPFESRFKDWCDTNYETIIRNFKDVKQHGLWIITKTCCTERWRIRTWRQKSRTMSIGLSVDAMNAAAKITGKGSWSKAETTGGWRGSGEVTSEPGKAQERFVIFVGGLKYKYSKLKDVLGLTPNGGSISKHLADKKLADVDGEIFERSLPTKWGMKDTNNEQ